MMLDTGYWMQDAGCKIQDARYRMNGIIFLLQSSIEYQVSDRNLEDLF